MLLDGVSLRFLGFRAAMFGSLFQKFVCHCCWLNPGLSLHRRNALLIYPLLALDSFGTTFLIVFIYWLSVDNHLTMPTFKHLIAEWLRPQSG